MSETLLTYIRSRFEVESLMYTTLCGVTFSHDLSGLVVFGVDEKLQPDDMLKVLDEHGCHQPEECLLNARLHVMQPEPVFRSDADDTFDTLPPELKK